MDKYINELNNELKDFNEVSKMINIIMANLKADNEWDGVLSEDFIKQFEEFLPNMTIVHNILYKSIIDLGGSVDVSNEGDED